MENNNLDENENNSTSHLKIKMMKRSIHQNYFLKNKIINQMKFSRKMNQENNDTDQLFDQDINEEEDFEIPAFLRKQKF